MQMSPPVPRTKRRTLLVLLAGLLLPVAGAQVSYQKRGGLSVREILSTQGAARAEAKLVRAAMDANLLNRWEYGYDSVVLVSPDDLKTDVRSRELLAHWTCFTLNDTFPIYCDLQSSIFQQWRKSQDEAQRRNIMATLSVILAHEQCHPSGCDEVAADQRAVRQIERLLATNRIDSNLAIFLRDYLRQCADRNEQEPNGITLRLAAPNP